MFSARVLSLAVTAALAAGTASSARAAGPTTPTTITAADLGMIDRAADQLATWMTWLPTRLETRSLTALPAEFAVSCRDLLAALRDRTTSLLALVPAPQLPDLTILTTSPVPGVESSGFGWRRHPILRYVKFHKGTDFRADRGTPVYAAGTGKVAFAGVKGGYGKVVFVDHGGGVVTRYAHLSSIDVREGALLEASTRLGRVGSTGRATGPHLHFEVRLEGRAVDPNVAMHVAALQRTDAAAARLAAWTLTPASQDDKIDRHDRSRAKKPARPERRHAPTRSRNRV